MAVCDAARPRTGDGPRGTRADRETLFAAGEGLVRASVSYRWRRLRSVPAHDRDDWAQMARWALWRATGDYDRAVGPFEPFASEYIRREIVDAVRRARPRGHRTRANPFLFVVREISLGDWGGDVACRPDTTRARAEAIEEARRLLEDGTLTARQREALRLRAVEGRSRADCARAMGISRKAVQCLLAAARAKLRRRRDRRDRVGREG